MMPMNGRLVKPNPMKPGMGKSPSKPGMPGPKPAPKAPGKSYDNDGPKRAQSPERFALMQKPAMKKPMPTSPGGSSKKAALQKRLGR